MVEFLPVMCWVGQDVQLKFLIQLDRSGSKKSGHLLDRINPLG